jgi:hypothetical protein
MVKGDTGKLSVKAFVYRIAKPFAICARLLANHFDKQVVARFREKTPWLRDEADIVGQKLFS